MFNPKYKLTENFTKDEQGNNVKIYGILVKDRTEIPDISCDKNIVTNLIERLGDEEIPLHQLMYIIEDSII